MPGQTSVLQFLSKLRRHASLEGAGPYFKRWKFDSSHRAASLDAKGLAKRHARRPLPKWFDVVFVSQKLYVVLYRQDLRRGDPFRGRGQRVKLPTTPETTPLRGEMRSSTHPSRPGASRPSRQNLCPARETFPTGASVLTLPRETPFTD